jgi:hypothetical protein
MQSCTKHDCIFSVILNPICKEYNTATLNDINLCFFHCFMCTVQYNTVTKNNDEDENDDGPRTQACS